MSKFLVTKKHYSDSNAKIIVGKQVLEIDNINKKRFSTIKKHFKTFIDIAFDSCGGNNIESIKLALGDTFKDLPIPTKSQHIFLSWFTSAQGGIQITSETLVSLDINTLYAQWEEVQIASDCTSYSVTTTSSYKNTGIYTASIADSSQPIYIDWGDGTVEKITSSISQKSHTYKTVGNFTVKINNNITSFAPSYSNSTWYGTTSQNRYTFKGMLTTGSKVTSLPTYAFYYCQAMTNIDFIQTCWPTITTIPNYCFYYCSNLKNITIPSTVQSIGNYTFYNCNKLTDLDLPDTVKTIGSYAFYGCTSLNYAGRMTNDLPYDAEIEYLEIAQTTCKVVTEDILPDSKNFKLILDCEQNFSSQYCAAISRYSSGGYGFVLGLRNGRPSVYTNKDNNISTISGIGRKMLSFYGDGNNLFLECENEIISVTDGSWLAGAGNITYFARSDNSSEPTPIGFKFYSSKFIINEKLFRNFIPVRVGNIGYMYDKVSGQLFGNSGTGSFILGPDVKTKELPSQLTSIGSYAYQGCNNLKSLNIPENLQTIGDYAFAGCYQISSIIDKRLTAQTVSTNTFGNTTGTVTNAYTGYQTKGNNILSTYFAATGYDENIWNDPLQNPDKCGFIQQYIDPENVAYHTITFDAGNGSIAETSKQIVSNRKIGELPELICPEDMPYFGGWYTAVNGEGDRITKDYRVTSDITLYALYSNTPFTSYEVILNNQWQASTIVNPDSNQYDGVYESFSNYNTGSKAAVMYIKIVGYTSFTIYIRSYAESSYDYTVAFNLDTYTPSNPLTSNPSSSTSGVKAHTSGKQNSGTAIGSYTKVEYTGIDSGEHYICVAYRKDGSVNNGTDRGYVLIDKQI